MSTPFTQQLQDVHAAINKTEEPPDFGLDDLGTATTILFLVAMATRAHRLTDNCDAEIERLDKFVDDLGHLVANFIGAEFEVEWPNLIER